jgi:transcription initiation factor TFIIIB Brf1 subunit/transcription initiation factor TFIIB
MKLTVNKGVREEMAALYKLFDEHDLLSARMGNDASLDDFATRQSVERRIVGTAARLLSHATRGKRFPMMTEGTYDTRGTW